MTGHHRAVFVALTVIASWSTRPEFVSAGSGPDLSRVRMRFGGSTSALIDDFLETHLPPLPGEFSPFPLSLPLPDQATATLSPHSPRPATQVFPGAGVARGTDVHPTFPRLTQPPGDGLAQPAIGAYRLPGEFEHHDILVLSCEQLALHHPDMFGEIVSETRKSIAILALVSDDAGTEFVTGVLRQRKVPARDIRFLDVLHDTMWVRDYGPFSVRNRGGQPAIVDTHYLEDTDRANDDQVPAVMADRLGMDLIRAPIVLEGGNLLSNGEGLCITTVALLASNANRNLAEDRIQHMLHRYLGADQTVFLEPLMGEPTGHVDMFALFASPDTVVIGSYDPLDDPLNAAILDRNAACLEQVCTRRGRLRVIRVPMPTNADGVWRTYTNAIFANGVLLVPVYSDVDPALQDVALNTLQQTLPGWRIVPIDAKDAIPFGGALHCVSKTILASKGWQDRTRQRQTLRKGRGSKPRILPARQASSHYWSATMECISDVCQFPTLRLGESRMQFVIGVLQCVVDDASNVVPFPVRGQLVNITRQQTP
jgi:agmatine/peptidylarginine deiminase